MHKMKNQRAIGDIQWERPSSFFHNFWKTKYWFRKPFEVIQYTPIKNNHEQCTNCWPTIKEEYTAMLKKQRGAKGEKAISLTEEISSVKATSVFT